MKIYLALKLSLFAAILFAGHSAFGLEMAKEFTEHKFKVTLPDENCKWMDTGTIPGASATAMFLSSDGHVFVTYVMEMPGLTAVDEDFVKGYDPEFFKGSELEKVDGRIGTHLGIPAYYISYRNKNNKSTGMNRVTVANSRIYASQIMGVGIPTDVSSDNEQLFKPFSFIGEPVAPPKQSGTPNNMAFSQSMGTLAAMILMLAVIVVVTKRLKK